jgi:hypothetical protein
MLEHPTVISQQGQRRGMLNVLNGREMASDRRCDTSELDGHSAISVQTDQQSARPEDGQASFERNRHGKPP